MDDADRAVAPDPANAEVASVAHVHAHHNRPRELLKLVPHAGVHVRLREGRVRVHGRQAKPEVDEVHIALVLRAGLNEVARVMMLGASKGVTWMPEAMKLSPEFSTTHFLC